MNKQHRHASIYWDDQGQPFSTEFSDIYFSRASGIDETRYVFLQGNKLAQRWSKLCDTVSTCFTIAETGFGTGLNFLCTWQLWDQINPNNAILHFISVEKFPLRKSDLIKSLQLWPELQHYATELIAQYPVTEPGFHRLSFNNNHVILSLIIDDAEPGLQQLLDTTHPHFNYLSKVKVNAWFLDGFSPAKNPAMWNEQLFSTIKALSEQGTTASTFSAASAVKKKLETNEFTVKKQPGFGNKREMITAEMIATPSFKKSDGESTSYTSPYQIPWTLKANGSNNSVHDRSSIAIIGAGIAGCSTANSLAARGFRVEVIEKNGAIADEASGNPQGMLYTKISANDSLLSQFYFHALSYAQHYYKNLLHISTGSTTRIIGDLSGLLQLAYNQRERDLFYDLRERYQDYPEFVQFVDTVTASKQAGIPVECDALFFPQCGWLNPPSLCRYWLAHSNIKTRLNTEVRALHWHDEKKKWQLLDDQQQIVTEATIVVIANSHAAKQLLPTQYLPLKSIRGQISYLPANSVTQALKTVICANGYITPKLNQLHCIGATYNLHEDSEKLEQKDHNTNIATAAELIPSLKQHIVTNGPSSGRVGFRCTSPDYMPLVGAVAHHHYFIKDYGLLRKNANANLPCPGRYLPELYANLAHGSKGLCSVPLCAELIAAEINQEPSPISLELKKAVAPARFIIKDLIRRKI